MCLQSGHGSDLDYRLNHLSRHGYVVIEGALGRAEYQALADRIRSLYHSGHDHGANNVGTIWFDDILAIDPDLFGSLIAHRSVRQELRALCRQPNAAAEPARPLLPWHLRAALAYGLLRLLGPGIPIGD
jgi:hypothetical protein